MSVRMIIWSLALACVATACTTAARDLEPRPDVAALAADEAAAATVERVLAPTKAMLAAALAGDPVEMQRAATQSACQAPSTCPATFGSCTGWSAPSQCSFSCISSQLCQCPFPEHPDDPPCEPDPSIKLGIETYNSFRICFNPSGQPCTEWRRTFASFCGC